MKLFRYIKNAYYRLFFFFFRMFKPNPFGGSHTDVEATVLAVLPFSFIWAANCFMLKNIAERFMPMPKRMSIGILLIIFLFNYLLFFHKKRYLKIKTMFENEEKRTRQKRTFFCIVFCFFSLFGMAIIDAIFGKPTIG